MKSTQTDSKQAIEAVYQLLLDGRLWILLKECWGKVGARVLYRAFQVTTWSRERGTCGPAGVHAHVERRLTLHDAHAKCTPNLTADGPASFPGIFLHLSGLGTRLLMNLPHKYVRYRYLLHKHTDYVVSDLPLQASVYLHT